MHHAIQSSAPILALALLATCAVAQAQRQVNSYSPARPTLSPYLYLTRQQNGPFPNYQTFVQPAQQQQQINRTQSLNINGLQQTQQSQQLQIDQTQQQQQQQQQFSNKQTQGMKIIPSSVAPTGIGGTYNNLSHYYGGGNGGAGGNDVSWRIRR